MPTIREVIFSNIEPHCHCDMLPSAWLARRLANQLQNIIWIIDYGESKVESPPAYSPLLREPYLG